MSFIHLESISGPCADKEDVDPCDPPGSAVQNIAHGQRRLLICEEEAETELSPLLPVAAAATLEGLVAGAIITPIGAGLAAAGVISGTASSPESSRPHDKHFDGAAHSSSSAQSPTASPPDDMGGAVCPQPVGCHTLEAPNEQYAEKGSVLADGPPSDDGSRELTPPGIGIIQPSIELPNGEVSTIL